jgi:hypothetical protein
MTIAAPWLRRLLIAAALASAALVPLLSTQLPRSADGRPHLYRLILLDHSIRNGERWPRYSPELAYGNGYPLFNFYAPLTYYLGVLLHAAGLEFVAALHAIFALTFVIGAWGTFTLAAEWFGEPAGVIAAAAFVFAPYTLFNALTRGAAPEALAVALLPWLLWSLHRALVAPTPSALARPALVFAALLLTHNLTAVLGTGLAIVWLVVEATALRPLVSRFKFHGLLVILSLISGLALAAFFWLPALLETGAAQVAQLTAPATLDFRNYFLTPAQLFAASFTFDPRLEPVTVPVSFGLAPALGALAALLMWRRYDARAMRLRVAVAFALMAFFLFLTLPIALPLWQAVGPLPVIQFPWRFLGPASVFAALLCGAAVGVLPDRRATLGAVVFVIALALTALPWSFVTRFPESQLPATPGLSDIFAYEVESGGFGLTSTGEFLPVAVKRLPEPQADWAAAAARGAVDRLDTEALPQSVTVVQSQSERLAARADFRSPEAFTATFRWFHFPGWQAEVDGQPAGIVPSDPHGFITVPVSAGEHRVRVFFGTTPIRQFAVVISMAGAIGLAASLGIARRTGQPAPPPPLIRTAYVAALIIVGLAVGALRLAIDERDTVFRQSRFDGQTVRGATRALDVDFGAALRLVAFDPPAATPADRPLSFTLYWTQAQPVTEDYSVAAQLWDAEGHLVGQQDAQHPNGAPTSRWLAGSYAADAHALTPYPGTLPGDYRLMIGVYPPGGSNVEVKNADGLPLGRFFEAARVAVLPPARPPTEAELNPAQPLRALLGPIQLLGVDGKPAGVTAGDDLPLVLYYRVDDEPLRNVLVQLELLSEDGTRTSLGAPPLLGEASAMVRAPYTFLIPPQTPARRAEVQASVYRSGGGRLAGPVTIGAVEVATPSRSFTPPPMEVTVEAAFGAAIDLLGFDMAAARPGEPLALTLYWQPREIVATRYSAFVHVLNPQGEIVAQSDATPGQGTRPTTGWLPPEVITDRHTLALPAGLPSGEYAVRVGLYDARTGLRLNASSEAGAELGDSLLLRTLTMP